MTAFRVQRQRATDDCMSAGHESHADAATVLWERLSIQIVALVGDAGFESLYAHSLYLAQFKFPWITVSTDAHPQPPPRFASLSSDLADSPPELAREANRLLLVIFTDLLASLIGEPLTERVLNSAWGNGVHDRIRKGQEND